MRRLVVFLLLAVLSCKRSERAPDDAATPLPSALASGLARVGDEHRRTLDGDLRGKAAFACNAGVEGRLRLAISQTIEGSCPDAGAKRLGAVLEDQVFREHDKKLDVADPLGDEVVVAFEEHAVPGGGRICAVGFDVASKQIDYKIHYELIVRGGVVEGRSYYSDPAIHASCNYGHRFRGTRTVD